MSMIGKLIVNLKIIKSPDFDVVESEVKWTPNSKISPLGVEVEVLDVTKRKEKNWSRMDSKFKDIKDIKGLNEFDMELLHIVSVRKEV